MDSFAQIIDRFGGAPAFGKAVGIPDSHARAMKARDSIPDGYWSRMVAAAAENSIEGVTLELLAELAEVKLRESTRTSRETVEGVTE